MALPAEHLERAQFPPPIDEWGTRLKFVRVFVADMSGAEFATHIDVKPSTYASWEKHPKKKPHDVLDVAERIHQLYPEVPREWLLYGGGCELRMYVMNHGDLQLELPGFRPRPVLVTP